MKVWTTTVPVVAAPQEKGAKIVKNKSVSMRRSSMILGLGITWETSGGRRVVGVSQRFSW
jgi:hypothetical protein